MAVNQRSHSNLQSFMDSTTPFIQPRSLPKSCFQDFSSFGKPSAGKDTVVFFTLGDIWNCYTEWSAFGAGVPVRLHSGETVVQYYVPSLSAMQIYSNKAPIASSTEAEDSWSEDSESEKTSKSWDAASGESGGSLQENEGSLPAKNNFGHLYFQFSESCSPYRRTPLLDKVHELAREYPRLTSFKSTDLSPASWLSVAWYPIYHIPTQRNVKDLDACFLTYHTLSSSLDSFQDHIPATVHKVDYRRALTGKIVGKRSEEPLKCIPLKPFGLSTYKMYGGLWVYPETGDEKKFTSLLGGACSWLKRLGVQHNDFNFFISSHVNRSRFPVS